MQFTGSKSHLLRENKKSGDGRRAVSVNCENQTQKNAEKKEGKGRREGERNSEDISETVYASIMFRKELARIMNWTLHNNNLLVAFVI